MNGEGNLPAFGEPDYVRRVGIILSSLVFLGYIQEPNQASEETPLFHVPGMGGDGDGLGLDSLGMQELLVTVEGQCGLSVPPDAEPAALITIGALALSLCPVA